MTNAACHRGGGRADPAAHSKWRGSPTVTRKPNLFDDPTYLSYPSTKVGDVDEVVTVMISLKVGSFMLITSSMRNMGYRDADRQITY
jgi:hypothetical protein